jgi:NAD(P)H-nitrite reductase large subunit
MRSEDASCGCERTLREKLMERTQCGQGCGLCEPYIKIMLRTGETAIPVLTAEQWDRVSRED